MSAEVSYRFDMAKQQPRIDILVGVFRKVGFINYLFTPLVLFGVGMSGDAGWGPLAKWTMIVAAIYFVLPWACSFLSKKLLAAGNKRTALITAGMPVVVLLMWGCLLLNSWVIAYKHKHPSPEEQERRAALEALGKVARYNTLCVREKGISSDQLKKLTEDYLRAHPDQAKEHIVLTTGEALAPICGRP